METGFIFYKCASNNIHVSSCKFCLIAYFAFISIDKSKPTSVVAYNIGLGYVYSLAIDISVILSYLQ